MQREREVVVMDEPRHGADRQVAGRVNELEALFTHLQRTVDELNQVVLAHQRKLDALEKSVAGLREALPAARDALEGSDWVDDEPPPPHY